MQIEHLEKYKAHVQQLIVEGAAVGMPTDIQQAAQALLAQIGHHTALLNAQQNAQQQTQEGGLNAHIKVWGESLTRIAHGAKFFNSKRYAGDVPFKAYESAYENYLKTGILPAVLRTDQDPKPTPPTVQQTHNSDAPSQQQKAQANAQAAEANDSESKENKAEQPPYIKKLEGFELAQELARMLDMRDTAKALQHTKKTLAYITQSASADAVRKNYAKYKNPDLNAVGVYLGIFDAKGIGEPNLIAAEAESRTQFVNKIYDAAQAWLKQQHEIQQAQNEAAKNAITKQ